MTSYPFIANLLCLDFVNTEPVRQGERVDLLAGLGDLLGWLEQAGAAPAEAVRRAEGWDETRAEAVFREAIGLRAALRGAAERLAAGKPPGDAVVRAVNRVLASRPAYPQLVREGAGYATRLQPVSDSALHLLLALAESAAWLLEHGDRSLVRRCEGERCVLFFYDTTKNASRRWCSMDGCGSRAKAVAYYRRKHPRGHRRRP